MPEMAAIMNNSSQRNAFERYFLPVSLAEGVSFLLLLCVAMPLKYAAGFPIAVSITGMVHGLLFIAYVMLALDGWRRRRWSIKRVAWVLVMSVLPTGAFFAERSVRAELAAPTASPEPVAA